MKIKYALKEMGITQKTLANMVSVHPVYLNSVINGRRNASVKLALRIEQATGGAVTLRELLFPDREDSSSE